jgi:hypothetical protein
VVAQYSDEQNKSNLERKEAWASPVPQKMAADQLEMDHGYIGRATEDGLSVGLEVVAFAQASLISSLASMACASPLASG